MTIDFNPDAPTFQKEPNLSIVVGPSPKAPECQRNQDTRKDIPNKICQAVLLDNTEKKVLIIYEQAFPIELRKWGLPKGKFKSGEDATECVHREVCEEVGIEVDKYPHVYRKKGRDHVIVFNKPAADIDLYIGPEILIAQWVDLEQLIKDVLLDIGKGEKDPNYNYIYNYAIRRIIPKLAPRTAGIVPRAGGPERSVGSTERSTKNAVHPVSVLTTLWQKNKYGPVKYKTLKVGGSNKNYVLAVECPKQLVCPKGESQTFLGVGTGKTLKVAKKNAANEAIQTLRRMGFTNRIAKILGTQDLEAEAPA